MRPRTNRKKQKTKKWRDVEGRNIDIWKSFQNRKYLWKKWTNMDKTIELSDSSADGTIHLDDTNKTIDLESSVEIEDKTASDHYVTAASNTKFLETPKITSTPNVQPPPLRPPNGVFLQVFFFFLFTASLCKRLYKKIISMYIYKQRVKLTCYFSTFSISHWFSSFIPFLNCCIFCLIMTYNYAML